MKLRGGFTNYGETIGILMLDTRFPRPRGDIGNALSYDFPVRYKIVRGAHATKIMGDHPDPAPARAVHRGGPRAGSRRRQGDHDELWLPRAIPETTRGRREHPGLHLEPDPAPLIHAMLPPGKVIGIFTERGHHMNEGHFRGVGWSPDEIPVQIQGMKPDAQFPDSFSAARNWTPTSSAPR